MKRNLLAVSLLSVALAVAPLSPASAHGYHGGLITGLAVGATAAVIGTAALLTAPVHAVAVAEAPPQPVYYAPAPAPVYYAPPQPVYYYSQPVVYYPAHHHYARPYYRVRYY